MTINSITYTNPWHNKDYQLSRKEFTYEVHSVYKGYQIVKRSQIEFHVVKNGVCVTMRAGLNGAKKYIK